jgi:hypothetical protein
LSSGNWLAIVIGRQYSGFGLSAQLQRALCVVVRRFGAQTSKMARRFGVKTDF